MQEIIETLKKMVTNKIDGLGYKQLYKKTDITTSLNDCYEFNLDQKFISQKNFKILNIIKELTTNKIQTLKLV